MSLGSNIQNEDLARRIFDRFGEREDIELTVDFPEFKEKLKSRRYSLRVFDAIKRDKEKSLLDSSKKYLDFYSDLQTASPLSEMKPVGGSVDSTIQDTTAIQDSTAIEDSMSTQTASTVSDSGIVNVNDPNPIRGQFNRERKLNEEELTAKKKQAGIDALRIEKEINDNFLSTDNTTLLNNEEEAQFQQSWNSDPAITAWKEQFVKQYGEEPTQEGYDYRGAWKAGVKPELNKEHLDLEGNPIYHWASLGKFGKELKPTDHETYWKSEFTQLVGENPDSLMNKDGYTEEFLKQHLNKAKAKKFTEENVNYDGIVGMMANAPLEYTKTKEYENLKLQLRKEKGKQSDYVLEYMNISGGKTPLDDNISKDQALKAISDYYSEDDYQPVIVPEANTSDLEKIIQDNNKYFIPEIAESESTSIEKPITPIYIDAAQSLELKQKEQQVYKGYVDEVLKGKSDYFVNMMNHEDVDEVIDQIEDNLGKDIDEQSARLAIANYKSGTEKNASRKYHVSNRVEQVAKQNGINIYDPNNAKAVKNIKKAVISEEIAYGVERLSEDEQKVYQLQNEINSLRKKQATTEDQNEQQKISIQIAKKQTEARKLKDNPRELFDVKTGKFVFAEDASDETKKYNDDINAEAIEYRKMDTDVLSTLYLDALSNVKYYEGLYNEKRNVTITLGDYMEQKVGVLQNMVVSRSASDMDKFAFREVGIRVGSKDNAIFDERIDAYKASRKRFDILNRALLTNEDPAGITIGLFDDKVREGVGGFVNTMTNSLVEQLGYKTITDDDFSKTLYTELSNAGVNLTPEQKEIAEEDISTMVAGGIGASIPIMAEIILTSVAGSPIAGATSASVRSVKALRLVRHMMKYKWGKTGEFLYAAGKSGINTSIQWSLTPSGTVGAAHGFGEGFVEGGWQYLDVANKFSGKYGKLVNTLLKSGTRAGVQTVAEFTQEYAGEFVNQVKRHGFDDIDRAFDQTFGQTSTEAEKKAAVTAIISATFAGTFEGLFHIKSAILMRNQITDPAIAAHVDKAIEQAKESLSQEQETELAEFLEGSQEGKTKIVRSKRQEELKSQDEAGIVEITSKSDRRELYINAEDQVKITYADEKLIPKILRDNAVSIATNKQGVAVVTIKGSELIKEGYAKQNAEDVIEDTQEDIAKVDKAINNRVSKFSLPKIPIMADMLPSITRAISRSKDGKPVDPISLDAAIEYLYNSYKESMFILGRNGRKQRVQRSLTSEEVLKERKEIEQTLSYLIDYKSHLGSQGSIPAPKFDSYQETEVDIDKAEKTQLSLFEDIEDSPVEEQTSPEVIPETTSKSDEQVDAEKEVTDEATSSPTEALKSEEAGEVVSEELTASQNKDLSSVKLALEDVKNKTKGKEATIRKRKAQRNIIRLLTGLSKDDITIEQATELENLLGLKESFKKKSNGKVGGTVIFNQLAKGDFTIDQLVEASKKIGLSREQSKKADKAAEAKNAAEEQATFQEQLPIKKAAFEELQGKTKIVDDLIAEEKFEEASNLTNEIEGELDKLFEEDAAKIKKTIDISRANLPAPTVEAEVEVTEETEPTAEEIQEVEETIEETVEEKTDSYVEATESFENKVKEVRSRLKKEKKKLKKGKGNKETIFSDIRKAFKLLNNSLGAGNMSQEVLQNYLDKVNGFINQGMQSNLNESITKEEQKAITEALMGAKSKILKANPNYEVTKKGDREIISETQESINAKKAEAKSLSQAKRKESKIKNGDFRLSEKQVKSRNMGDIDVGSVITLDEDVADGKVTGKRVKGKKGQEYTVTRKIKKGKGDGYFEYIFAEGNIPLTEIQETVAGEFAVKPTAPKPKAQPKAETKVEPTAPKETTAKTESIQDLVGQEITLTDDLLNNAETRTVVSVNEVKTNKRNWTRLTLDNGVVVNIPTARAMTKAYKVPKSKLGVVKETVAEETTAPKETTVAEETTTEETSDETTDIEQTTDFLAKMAEGFKKFKFTPNAEPSSVKRSKSSIKYTYKGVDTDGKGQEYEYEYSVTVLLNKDGSVSKRPTKVETNKKTETQKKTQQLEEVQENESNNIPEQTTEPTSNTAIDYIENVDEIVNGISVESNTINNGEETQVNKAKRKTNLRKLKQKLDIDQMSIILDYLGIEEKIEDKEQFIESLEEKGIFETNESTRKFLESAKKALQADASAKKEQVEKIEALETQVEETKKQEQKTNDALEKEIQKLKEEAPEISATDIGIAIDAAKILKEANHPWTEGIEGDFVEAVKTILNRINSHAKLEKDYSREFKDNWNAAKGNRNSARILAKVEDKAVQKAKLDLIKVLNKTFKTADAQLQKQTEVIEKALGNISPDQGSSYIEKGIKNMKEGISEGRSSTQIGGLKGSAKWFTGASQWVYGHAINAARNIPFYKNAIIKKYGSLTKFFANPFNVYSEAVNQTGLLFEEVGSGLGKLIDSLANSAYKVAKGKINRQKVIKIYKGLIKPMSFLTNKVIVPAAQRISKAGYIDVIADSKIQYQKVINDILNNKSIGTIADIQLSLSQTLTALYNQQAKIQEAVKEGKYSKEELQKYEHITYALNEILNDIKDMSNYNGIRGMLKAEAEPSGSRSKFFNLNSGAKTVFEKRLLRIAKDEVTKLMYSRYGNIEVRRRRLEKLARGMSEEMTEAERNALTFILDGSKSVPSKTNFKKGTVDKNEKFRNEVQYLIDNPTDAINKFKPLVKAEIEAIGKYMQNNKQLSTNVDLAASYFPHFYKIIKFDEQYKNQESFKKFVNNTLSQNAKGNKWGNYEEAIGMGFDPVTLDASKLMKLYSEGTNNFIENKNFTNSLLELTVDGNQSGAKLAYTEGSRNIPPSYKKIDNPRFRAHIFDMYKTKKQKDLFKEEEKGQWVSKYIYVHPKVYQQIQGIVGVKTFNWEQKYLEETGRSVNEISALELLNPLNDIKLEYKQKVFLALERWNNFTKKINLTMSAFHHLALTETLLSTPDSFTRGIKYGANLLKLFTGFKTDDFLIFKESESVNTELAIKHGLQVKSAPDQHLELHETLLDELEYTWDSSFKTNLNPFRKDKGVRKITNRWDDFLWDYMHNNYKLVAFQALYADAELNLSKKLDSDKITVNQYKTDLEAVGRAIAKHVDNTFGGQNWQLLSVNPKTLRLASLVLLSPDWTVSTAKQALAPFAGFSEAKIFQTLDPSGNARDYVKRLGIDVGSNNEFANKFVRKAGYRFWASVALKQYMFMNLINMATTAWFGEKDEEEQKEFEKLSFYGKLMTGRPMWKNDPDLLTGRNSLGIFIGVNPEDGKADYVHLGKQMKELPELIFNPLGRLLSKSSPLPQAVSRVLFGMSPSGYDLYDLQDDNVGNQAIRIISELGLSTTPFFLQNQIRSAFQPKYTPTETWTNRAITFFAPIKNGTNEFEVIKGFKESFEDKDPHRFADFLRVARENSIPVKSVIKRAQREYIREKEKELLDLKKDKNSLASTNPLVYLAYKNLMENQFQAFLVGTETQQGVLDVLKEDEELFKDILRKRKGASKPTVSQIKEGLYAPEYIPNLTENVKQNIDSIKNNKKFTTDLDNKNKEEELIKELRKMLLGE